MTTQQDVIKQFMASLDNTTLIGMEAFEEAVKACSKFGSLQEAIDQMIIDRKASTDEREFLLKYCGINLNNLDTGAITGFDADDGDDYVFNNRDEVTINAGAGADRINNLIIKC